MYGIAVGVNEVEEGLNVVAAALVPGYAVCVGTNALTVLAVDVVLTLNGLDAVTALAANGLLWADVFVACAGAEVDATN